MFVFVFSSGQRAGVRSQHSASSRCKVVRARRGSLAYFGAVECSPRGRVGVRGELMEHLSPAGGVRDAAGSSNNAGTEALSMEQDNNSVHHYADIESQAGSAAAVESSTSHHTTQGAAAEPHHYSGQQQQDAEEPQQDAAELAEEWDEDHPLSPASLAMQEAELAESIISMLQAAPNAPSRPSTRELVRAFIRAGLREPIEVALAVYLCGQPPHVANVILRIIHASLEEGHERDVLVQHAHWISLFGAMLSDPFATRLARAACANFVREHGSGRMLLDVQAESRPLLLTLQKLLVREMQPLLVGFRVDITSGTRKHDLQLALHTQIMKLALAGMHAQDTSVHTAARQAIVGTEEAGRECPGRDA